MVIASFPEKHANRLSENLKKVLLSVSFADDKPRPINSGLPFSITAAEGLVMVEQMKALGMAAFTMDGKMPVRSPEDPLFIVAPSLGKVSVGEKRSFAVRRLKATASVEDVFINSIADVRINALAGLEIIANAKHQQAKTPLRVFQIMLFPDGGGYVLMTGRVGVMHAESYIPKFRATSKTYKTTTK